jgi:capsular exopolysaccharide synthesis family protein
VSATTNGRQPDALQTPADSPDDGRAGPRAFLDFVRRRWLLILIPVIVVPAAALAFSLRQAEEYTANASLLFQDSGGSTLASDDPTREAATNVKLLEVGVLKERVERKYGPAIAGADIKVVAEEDSNLVTMEAVASSPETASRAANAYAREYAAYRRDIVRQDLQSKDERLADQIAGLPATKRGRQDRRTLVRRLRRLRLAEGNVATDVRVVRTATPPASPSAPKPMRNTLIGLFAGLLIGLGIAALRERMDLRIRDARFFEAAVGRPILARIPRSRALRRSPTRLHLPPAEGQAFANLRANLTWAINGHKPAIAVTSAEPGEGKTTVVWNLACAMASPHNRVIVVEADLRRPALSNSLGGSSPGLSEVLEGRATLAEAIRELNIPRAAGNGNGKATKVDALFAGGPASDPTALIESDRMRDVLDALVAHYDMVLIDTPPTSVASDVVPLIGRVGGVLVVGRLAKSRSSAVAEFGDEMRRLGAPTLGVVVNSCELPRETYRYYYSGRG